VTYLCKNKDASFKYLELKTLEIVDTMKKITDLSGGNSAIIKNSQN